MFCFHRQGQRDAPIIVKFGKAARSEGLHAVLNFTLIGSYLNISNSKTPKIWNFANLFVLSVRRSFRFVAIRYRNNELKAKNAISKFLQKFICRKIGRTSSTYMQFGGISGRMAAGDENKGVVPAEPPILQYSPGDFEGFCQIWQDGENLGSPITCKISL